MGLFVPSLENKSMARYAQRNSSPLLRISSDNLSPHQIVSGKNTKEGEVPWHVILEDMNCGTRCGGTIINLRYILTAAHCIDSFKQKSDDFCPEKKSKGSLPYPANILGKYYCSLSIF